DSYFIANTSNMRQTVKATFRAASPRAEWWDPFSGKTIPAKIEARTTAGSTIALDLEPYESRVLVFSKRVLPAATSPAPVRAPAPIDISTGWRITIGDNTLVADHL